MEEYQEYLTYEDYETAKANGISYANAYARFYNYGWSVKRTITTPIGQRSKGLWPTYREQCEKVGVSQDRFYDRIRYRGWTPEEAATKPPLPPDKRHKHKNTKITKDTIEKAAKNGISEGTLKHRVYSYKWEVERAVTEPTKTNYRSKSYEANRARS